MASHMAMPIVIVNLGGEMMYVLRQRLEAQQIPQDKARQVLDEVIGAMFNEAFIKELFKPSPTYTFEATKHIFQKLAHCSIMKLNETSMSKLYDLMTMVFKFQIVSSRSPRDIVDISLQHIDQLRSMVSESLTPLLDNCAKRIQTQYGGMSSGQIWVLRQTLLEFLKGRNVKISLLLQENFQARNGRFFIDLNGSCPEETPVPGKVRYFDVESNVSREHEVDLGIHRVARINEFDENDYRQTTALLGDNLYIKYRGGASAKPDDQAESNKSVNNDQENESDPEDEQERDAAETKCLEQKSVSGADEMNILADLIVPPKGNSRRSASLFRLNLFGAANEDFNLLDRDCTPVADVDDEPRPSAEAKHFDYGPTVKVNAKATHRSLNDRVKDLSMDYDEDRFLSRRVEAGARKVADEDEDDDLLDLMDEAVAAEHK